jgi:hypothetical protein
MGVDNKKTHWQCFVGQPDLPDFNEPFDHEFDLE